ncbi:hypothetical protein R1flu_001658 [Riccia fluitans]|uniref:Uncharacterized protein n=1 Tax=Riccia fluitans TaxID=41844 RepID=A0ABD1Y452_9MARC
MAPLFAPIGSRRKGMEKFKGKRCPMTCDLAEEESRSYLLLLAKGGIKYGERQEALRVDVVLLCKRNVPLLERQNLNPSCEWIDERNVRRLVDCAASQTLQRNSNIIALPGDKLLKRQFAWPTAFLVTAHFGSNLLSPSE